MGQALQRLRSTSQNSLPQLTKVTNQPRPPRQSVEIKPTPPEPRPVVEPSQNLGDWDPSDPKYAMMVQQVVGRITTRPGGKPEMGEAQVSAEQHRAKPVKRHTSAATGPDDDVTVAPGSMNLRDLRELFVLHQGQADNTDQAFIAETLAKRYKLDVVLVEKMLKYTSLPTVKSNASDEGQN